MVPKSDLTPIRILQLRIVIARAAQRDSLSWWDDEALTPDANLLLRRLFPRSVSRAAWLLALRAARARHDLALADLLGARHLFDLGAEIEDKINVVSREQTSVEIPLIPITSRGQLATVLRAIAPEPIGLSTQSTGSNRVRRLDNEVASLPIVDRAITLAWAYAIPDSAGLVVPFYLPASEGM